LRAVSLLKHDFLFQFRHRFYYAYFFILAVYYSIISNISGGIKEFLTIFILFSDTTVLGFFFVGGLILLERDQNTLQSIFVTPVKVGEYLFSKTVSLTILSYIASIFIALAAFGFPDEFLLFSAGAILSSTFFIFTGIAIAVRSKTVNKYFFNAIVFTMIFFVPIVDFVGIFKSDLFMIFPTYATVTLFKSISQDFKFLEIFREIDENPVFLLLSVGFYISAEFVKMVSNCIFRNLSGIIILLVLA
jgi:fluoroquinolone transport system permease protein